MSRARTASQHATGTPPAGGAGAAGGAGGHAAYRVAPQRLTDAAGHLTEQAGRLRGARTGLDATPLAPHVFGGLPQSQQAASAHRNTLTAAGQQLDTHLRRLGVLSGGLTNGAANYRHGDRTVADGFRALLGGDTVAPVAGKGAAAGAGAGGGAFADRIAANRPRIADALTAEERNHAMLLAEQHAHDDRSWLGRFFDGDGDLADRLAKSQSRIDLYQDILQNDRKIIAFDPAGNGRIAELVGDINSNTKNVGVLVPGTFTNMANFDKYAADGRSFVEADPTHSLAMVVWADGDNPQSLGLGGAADPSYSEAMAPNLATFSHQLRDQINAQGAGDAQVTFAGHSYGGAVVGLAEHDGLDANRVLHIESAGMGHDVWTPGDLHNTQSEVQRYSMTAPGDPIGDIQGVQLLGYGHGADPNTFPGVTDLVTGNYPDGHPLHGVSAHTDIFTYHSDAWWNMYGVFTGGIVTPVPPPVPDPTPPYYGP
ncbi:hypothetical protein F0L68_01585 [Solihabitans fulvus]|uniref:DUF1023 domain-containing protein n=1 Tax=Solihabitans fulvus TaxID=1892852 RepID=A0A5B2XSF6_9PSEU|nr:hypothetical protein F0L68_01585 [Solihabitans fulvus]